MLEILQQAIAFTGTIAVITGTITLIAKSPIGKFLIKAFKREARDLMLESALEANKPLEEVATVLQEKQHEISDQVEQLSEYTRHHLGPNGLTPPLYTRIIALEAQMVAQADTARQVRTDLQAHDQAEEK